MKIIVLPGDGIGAETVAVAVDALEHVSKTFKLGLKLEHDTVSYTHLTLPTKRIV